MLVCLSLWPADEPATCPRPPSARDSWDEPQECKEERRQKCGWMEDKTADSLEVPHIRETHFSWLLMIAQLSVHFGCYNCYPGPKMWDVSGALRRHVFLFEMEKISCQRQTGSAFDGANLHSVVEGGGVCGVGGSNPPFWLI